MEKERKPNLPTVGFTTGDINGVGPELIIEMFQDNRMFKICTPVVFGSGRLFGKYRKFLKLDKFHFSQIDSLKEAKKGRLNILNVWSDDVEIQPGQEVALGGQKAFESLKAATDNLVEGNIDALVTAPISKNNIQQEGFQFPGHTEYLAERAKQKEHLMLMTTEDLKIGVVTGHIPLGDVKQSITEEVIIKKTTLLNKTIKNDFGIAKPKIAVLGLNPHAGDGGVLGREEIEIIQPALEKLREKNILAMGPYSGDGFFGSYEFKKFDAVLAMYHDQGLIPFKTIAFEKGVNYTAGLPIIRTSPDHGTAFSLAGKRQANPTSFREAVYLACDIWKQRHGEEVTQDELVATDS